jgi:hypothetical protein
MSEPINILQIIRDLLNGDFPDLGIDQHLRWWGAVHDGIYDWVDSKGLTGAGKEVYIFVAPRDSDIRHPITRVMSGLGSYAGIFPMNTRNYEQRRSISGDYICKSWKRCYNNTANELPRWMAMENK